MGSEIKVNETQFSNKTQKVGRIFFSCVETKTLAAESAGAGLIKTSYKCNWEEQELSTTMLSGLETKLK